MAVHKWRFFRAGGVDQVSLLDADDLASLDQLDPKLWVALAMPTRGIDLDKVTLDLVDTDHDGRIRIAEILDAVRWIEKTFKQPADVLHTATKVELASLADPKIVAAAKRMLHDLGKAEATAIGIDDAIAVNTALTETKLNGDGIVTPESTDDVELKRAITEAIGMAGSLVDRSGKPGIDKARADQLFAEVDQRATWLAAGKALGAGADPDRAAMLDALEAVRDKIEDYFARCRLVAFDPRAAATAGGQDSEIVAITSRELTTGDAEIAKLPIARVDASARLPLSATVNPAWAERLRVFSAIVVTPIIGPRDSLTAAELATIVGDLEPLGTWRKAKPTTKADALDVEWLHVLASPTGVRTRLADLITADAALADDYTNSAEVRRAVYFQRDFGRLLRNFVNFSDFYSHQDGLFQTGTLYLDARALRLCVTVADPGKHAALAASSDAYLVYCDLVRGADKLQIVGALTNGDEENVFAGRNGVFYDRAGNDWDATVVKVVGNPISIRQAFWSPYKKVVRAVEDMVNKRAQASNEEAESTLSTTAGEIATAETPAGGAAPAPAAPAAPPPPPVQTTLGKKIDLGTVAALGVAVGGIGTLVGALLNAIFGLGPWLPFGFAALLLLVSGPSMLLAWLKLHRRNLGPILDANGWAINGRAKINVAFGAAMTELAKLPPGSQTSVDDPFSDKKSNWRRWVILLIVLVIAGLWYFGRIDRYLPIKARSTSLLGEHAPRWDEAQAEAQKAAADKAAADKAAAEKAATDKAAAEKAAADKAKAADKPAAIGPGTTVNIQGTLQVVSPPAPPPAPPAPPPAK